MTPGFIGIDWGTTHRRAWLLDAAGATLARHADDDGMLACAGRFRASLQALLQRWPAVGPAVPVVMAGMVGAASGWQEAPYLDAEVAVAALPRHLVAVRDAPPGAPWYLVPGYRFHDAAGRVDVMRGEETQLLGALELLGPADADGAYVLPGTHSKWVDLAAGRIAGLRTYLSGELFALLRAAGTLSGALQTAPADAAPDPAVFARGVAEAGAVALTRALFGVRARVVTGELAPAAAASWLSGLLIGAEWHAERRASVPPPRIRIVGEPALARLHARCAAQLGLGAETLDAPAVQEAAWRAFARERRP